MKSKIETLFERCGGRLAATLQGVEGLSFNGDGRGAYKMSGVTSRVELEAADWLRVAAPVEAVPPPLEALRLQAEFPGNVRYCRSRGAFELAADTQIDGQAHLARTFFEIGSGLAQATGRRVRKRPPAEEPIDAKDVQHALDELQWDEDAVVKLEDEKSKESPAWELRPRLRGAAQPVRARLETGGLRVTRTVVGKLDEACLSAVAVEALRLGGQVRFARYVLSGDRLVAEARLHAGQIGRHWLSLAAHAVAVAAGHAAPLKVLRDEDDVRRLHGQMFVWPK